MRLLLFGPRITALAATSETRVIALILVYRGEERKRHRDKERQTVREREGTRVQERDRERRTDRKRGRDRERDRKRGRDRERDRKRGRGSGREVDMVLVAIDLKTRMTFKLQSSSKNFQHGIHDYSLNFSRMFFPSNFRLVRCLRYLKFINTEHVDMTAAIRCR